MSQASRRANLVELEARFRGTEFFSFADRWAEKQKSIIASKKRFLFLFGGNGAGKSKLGSKWAANHALSINPEGERVYRRLKPPSVYLVGTTLEKTEGVLVPNFMAWIPKNEIEEVDRKHGIITLKGGARVFKKAIEQGVDSFKGNECDAIWVDEEPRDRRVWTECLARTFRRLGQLLVTLTADHGTEWLHSWVHSPDYYPMEQKEIVEMPTDLNPYYYDCDHCGHPEKYHGPRTRGASPGLRAIGIGCERNGCNCRHFSNVDGQKKLAQARMQYKGIEYQIRFLGRHLLMAGTPILDPDVLRMKREREEQQPLIGFLTDALKFEMTNDPEDARSYLRISAAPLQGATYVIGADPGGGNPTGDYHAAVVICYETGEQVALLHTRALEPKDFGRNLVKLAYFYNNAFVVPEANNHGISVIDTMIEAGFGNMYKRRVPDKMMIGPPTKKLGFWTDYKTKTPAVDLMKEYFLRRWKVRDPLIYSEAYHYTWLKSEKMRDGTHGIGNSNPDGHDDIMTACFLAAKGLQYLGWGIVPKDEIKVQEPAPSLGDMLIENSLGRELSEEEILEGMPHNVGELDEFDEQPSEWEAF